MPLFCMYVCTNVCIYVHLHLYQWAERQKKSCSRIQKQATTLLDLPACLWLRCSLFRSLVLALVAALSARRRWSQFSVRFASRFSVLFYSPAFQVDIYGLQTTCTHTYTNEIYTYTYVRMYVCLLYILIGLGQKSVPSLGVFSCFWSNNSSKVK